MSIFVPADAPCPNCGSVNRFDHFASVNADRRPDLKDDILSGAFMRIKCSACGTDFRPEPSLNYLDYAAGLWVMARPLGSLAHWDEEAQKAGAAFDDAYGAAAPAAARDIGAALTARVTFGWAAFREKLVLAREGLDDLTLEKTKIAILRNKPGNPVAPGVELRLLGVYDPVFHMGWVSARTNEALQVFTVKRALYDDIAGDASWAALDTQVSGGISGGFFVDMQRMFITPEPPKAAALPAG